MTISYNFDFLKRLKELGLSQDSFSGLVGDDPSIVSRIINGIWNPDKTRKVRYARALKCKVEDLFND